jgi:hypothetical protein
MVLAYNGLEADQHALARQLDVIEEIGAPASRVLRLNSPSFAVTYREGDDADLRTALARGTPPILSVTTGELPYWDEDTAHAIVLVGMNDETALVNDPAFEEAPVSVRIGDLLLAWDEAHNAVALIERR